MKLVRNILPFFACLSVLLLANACSSSVDEVVPDETVIPVEKASTLMPTQLSGQGLLVTQNNACLVKELVAIQVDNAQGNLLAWSPESNQLAFVEPVNKSWGWFIGNLNLYDLDSDKSIFLSQDKNVYGDLTWSPDGNYLAYVTLNQENKTYSIEVSGVDDESTLEVFSGNNNADTDDWADLKGINGWNNTNILVVSSSCGQDCVRVFNFSVAKSQLAQQKEIRKNEDLSLSPDNEEFSPDRQWQITTDENDNVWLTSVDSKKVSLLLSDTAVDEIKWNANSTHFALRSEGKILIYQPVCSKK